MGTEKAQGLWRGGRHAIPSWPLPPHPSPTECDCYYTCDKRAAQPLTNIATIRTSISAEAPARSGQCGPLGAEKRERRVWVEPYRGPDKADRCSPSGSCRGTRGPCSQRRRLRLRGQAADLGSHGG